MISAWFKRFLPRGLYGRAALILILPIVTLQLVVSLAFLQRHFEGVTRQMTRNITFEIKLIAAEVAGAPGGASEAAQRLGNELAMEVVLPAGPGAPDADTRVFYDLSGRVIMATLREAFPEIGPIALGDLRRVVFTLPTTQGPMLIAFDRGRVSASNPHQLLVLMLFTGLLMTLIAFLFLRNQLRPIRRLARAAEAFGKGRVEPYKPSGALEVRSAGNAFLDMRGRIERQIEQRTLLLSGVSHDLRTPLSIASGWLMLLQSNPKDPLTPQQREWVSNTVDAVHNTTELINDLFDLSKLEVGGLAVYPEETDLTDFLRGVYEVAQAMSWAEGVSFKLDLGDDLPTMWFDPLRIRQVINNLLSNANKFTSRGSVTLHAHYLEEDDEVLIGVADTGEGIPADKLETLFNRFEQVEDENLERRRRGTGLGLNICRSLRSPCSRGWGRIGGRLRRWSASRGNSSSPVSWTTGRPGCSARGSTGRRCAPSRSDPRISTRPARTAARPFAGPT